MKLLLATALFCFCASTTFAQASSDDQSGTSMKAGKKHHRMTKMSTTQSQPPSGEVGAEVSGITGSAPGDPYNVNHPFFNGEARWSNADTLYKHGDFPWAMVAEHPDNFRFNAESGQWEMIGTPPSMGNAKRTR